MHILDWIVIGVYLLLMLVGAYLLGRRQNNKSDYYLGANQLPSWALATSIIATQCSTNSLLGAPAFVGFVLGGGLIWLQYELAVPLAMLALCYLFVPIKRSGVISIYAYLETRLGRETRLLASAVFLFFRAVATGVVLYGVASVIELVTGLSFFWSVLLLMSVTLAYDVMGGIRAVVLSDVVQMALLLGAVFVALVFLFPSLVEHWPQLSDRTMVLVNDTGLRSGQNYGFWPMLIGGFFLYVAYYGCDQSQAQRLLSAKDERATQKVLMLNGLFRFPLVLSYCLLGLGLAAYAIQYPDFISGLPLNEAGSPNLNMVFPSYVFREFAPGLVGLVVVGLFAAAMSSIDSALNSLSASTLEDFVPGKNLNEARHFLLSKLLTLVWGLFVILFSFQVESIAPTVLEAINKIGSLANGPLLAVFTIAICAPGMGQRAVITGFFTALLVNIAIWQNLNDLSWLWWNPIGFFACWLVALAVAAMTGRVIQLQAPDAPIQNPYLRHLVIGAVGLFLLLVFIGWL